MTRCGVGLGFCGIAAFLLASRYVCAAIWGSSLAFKSGDLFRAMYGYVGSGLSVAAVASLILGVAYIIWGELSDRQR